MHGSLAANQALLAALKARLAPREGIRYAVCAPFPYLHQVAAALAGTPIFWGAQNVSERDVGAYTGEVSGAMLREFGCRYVIVGHSERRGLYGETDLQIAAKFMAAQRAGLTPVLCAGETLEQRDRGDTEMVIGRQIEAVLNVAGVSAIGNAVIAYEPVWAIGTGKTATPRRRAMTSSSGCWWSSTTRHWLRRSILYGGSVRPGNARELFAMPDVDGGLIGGASLVADDFIAICEAAGQH
jgi:triosephosphate isomerase